MVKGLFTSTITDKRPIFNGNALKPCMKKNQPRTDTKENRECMTMLRTSESVRVRERKREKSCVSKHETKYAVVDVVGMERRRTGLT